MTSCMILRLTKWLEKHFYQGITQSCISFERPNVRSCITWSELSVLKLQWELHMCVLLQSYFSLLLGFPMEERSSESASPALVV